MNMEDIAITKNRQSQKYKLEIGTELGCLIRILEYTALCTTLGGIIDTDLLEDLGGTFEATFGEILGATLDANFGQKKS